LGRTGRVFEARQSEPKAGLEDSTRPTIASTSSEVEQQHFGVFLGRHGDIRLAADGGAIAGGQNFIFEGNFAPPNLQPAVALAERVRDLATGIEVGQIETCVLMNRQ